MAKATTKVYAIDLWVEDDVITIQPYPYRIVQLDNYKTEFQADKRTEAKVEPFKVNINDSERREVVAYILDSEEFDNIRSYWDGYSLQDSTQYLTVGDTPAIIQEWLDNLPEYELELV